MRRRRQPLEVRGPRKGEAVDASLRGGRCPARWRDIKRDFDSTTPFLESDATDQNVHCDSGVTGDEMMGAQVLARAPRNQRVNERGTPEECQDMHVLKMNVLYAWVNHPGINIPDWFFPEPRAHSVVARTDDSARLACLSVGLFEQPTEQWMQLSRSGCRIIWRCAQAAKTKSLSKRQWSLT